MDPEDQFFVVRPRNNLKEKAKKQQSSKIVHKFNNYRISSQAILNQSQQTVSLIQSVTCPICLMILPIPYYQCQVCSNGFCPKCLENWWMKEPNKCIFKCEAADFKLIKRSNTYNAVAAMLKVPCQYCKEDQSVGELVDHLIKHCPNVNQACEHCSMQFPRKQIKIHDADCPKKPYECFYCKNSFLTEVKPEHEQQCPEKLLKCCHELCEQQIRRASLPEHIQKCPFKMVSCEWCQRELLQRQLQDHLSTCDKRMLECKWCKNGFKIPEYMNHQCHLAQQLCPLCMRDILKTQMASHKMECMFSNVLQLKTMNQKLVSQNIELKEKISLLEDIIEESLANRKTDTLKIFRDMKDAEKVNLQRDLLRIDNSIKSIEKLKGQQFESHMKFPHLIQSWCPICKELDKKFKAMLEPLLLSRKEVLKNLAEVEKFNTPK